MIPLSAPSSPRGVEECVVAKALIAAKSVPLVGVAAVISYPVVE